MRRAKSIFRALGRFLLGVASVAAVGLIILEESFYLTGQALDEELAKARAAGIPVDAADLRRITYVPPADNAAPLYDRALQRIRTAKGYLPPKFSDVVRGSYPPLAPDVRDKILRQGLPLLSAALDDVARGAVKPGLDWRRKWEDGFDLASTEATELRNAVRLLAIRSRIRTQDGDFDGAIDDIETSMRVAQHVWNEPLIHAYMAGVGTEGVAMSALTDLFKAPGLSLQQCQRIRAMLEKAPDLPTPALAIEGHMVFTRILLHNPAQRELVEVNPVQNCWGGTPDPPQPPTDPAFWAVRNEPCRKAWEVKAIHYTVLYSAALRQKGRSLIEIGRITEACEKTISDDMSVENRFNLLLFPFVAGYGRSYCTELAKRRLNLQAAAVLAVRKQTGRLPADLPVTGDAAIDPFSGRPLRYFSVANGFKIYSVDQDLIDDGGLTRSESRKTSRQSYDLAVILR